MDHDAIRHLSKDKILQGLLKKYQIREYWGGRNDPFLDLVEIVTGQQLSMKAAKSIFDRFLNLYSDSSRSTGWPSPQDVLATPDDKLRATGFSLPKVSYVKNIAAAFVSGEVSPDNFRNQTDEEIIKDLTKIKGLGPWSVEMFLIFSLKRPDVFSVGDLGLRTAIEKLYGISRDDKKAILSLADTWRPHRTLACRLLWSSL